mmetsp:Transcript_36737/g.84567  ORF Transcript_36737/g.84567 Transcript_36737/m.84567 type:complete len:208 (-) Transcript_36737:26-649(-)
MKSNTKRTLECGYNNQDCLHQGGMYPLALLKLVGLMDMVPTNSFESEGFASNGCSSTSCAAVTSNAVAIALQVRACFFCSLRRFASSPSQTNSGCGSNLYVQIDSKLSQLFPRTQRVLRCDGGGVALGNSNATSTPSLKRSAANVLVGGRLRALLSAISRGTSFHPLWLSSSAPSMRNCDAFSSSRRDCTFLNCVTRYGSTISAGCH